jgi:hypothetical protein
MAGSITVSSITLDSDNNFSIKSNTGATLFFANTTGIDIANSIGATAITNDKILSVANTKISGNIASSQIAPDQTLNGNVSVTGTLSAGAVSGTTGTFTGAVSGTTGTFTGAVTTPLSYVRLNTANGYGSTNTKIRRFTNIVDNVGTDITYADSATLGATFTINTSGVYSVSFSDQNNAAAWVGLSINSTQLTTTIADIAVANILSAGYTPRDTVASTVSAVFYAAASAVVRAHTGGTASGTATQCTQFTIARVR